MLYYEELKEAVDKGFVKGNTVQIVRKEGKIFDYVLPGEPVKDDEVVTMEKVDSVLQELKEEEILAPNSPQIIFKISLI